MGIRVDGLVVEVSDGIVTGVRLAAGDGLNVGEGVCEGTFVFVDVGNKVGVWVGSCVGIWVDVGALGVCDGWIGVTEGGCAVSVGAAVVGC